MANPIEQLAAQLGEHPEEKSTEKNGEEGSQLSGPIALDVVAIVRDELTKLGCRLVDYHIGFTADGFDLTGLKIKIDDPGRIIQAVKSAAPEVRHEVSNSPTKYAYMAANVEIARRVDEELGLDYKAYAYDKSDAVQISVGEPAEEKPLPLDQEIEELPPELVQGVEEPLEPVADELGIEGPTELDLPPATGGGGGGAAAARNELLAPPPEEGGPELVPGEEEEEEEEGEEGEEEEELELEGPEEELRPGEEY